MTKNIIKKVRKIWGRIRPVSCRRCGGYLYSKTERTRGISSTCRRREIEEKSNQIKTTEMYFFTVPGNTHPSPMYYNIGDILKAPGFTPKCQIWTGTYQSPVEVKLTEVEK